jgi:hypothetical protein
MELILFYIYFIFASLLAFYIPGKVVLGTPKNLSKIGDFAVSYILGIVLWGWQGYVFGFLHLRNLSYLYLLVFLLLFLRKKYFFVKIPKINFKKIDLISLLIILVGIFSQTFQFIKIGQVKPQGIFMIANNSVDAVWHASLVTELVKHFPPFEPGMYGVNLVNYHFWFNFVTAELVRVFNLPVLSTMFSGMYVLVPILLGLIGYALAKIIYNNKFFLRLFLFLLFFAGDASFWAMGYFVHVFNFNAGWIFEDASKFMDIPGRGIAEIIFFAGLYLLIANKEKLSFKNIFFLGILFGSLYSFKVYFGISVLVGLFCLSIFKLIKKEFSYFGILIIASIFTLCQFLPFNSSSGLFFLPLDMPREYFVQAAYKMTWIDLRLEIYRQHSNYFRLVEYFSLMTIGYLIFQFGTKIIGLIPLKRNIVKLNPDISVFLYSILFASLGFGLFFYQKVGGANIYEFFLVSSMVLVILTSLTLSLYLPKNKIVTFVLILVFLIITLPRWVYSVTDYAKTEYFSGFHGVTNQELQIYNYLKNYKDNSSLLVLGKVNYTAVSSIMSVLTDKNIFLLGSGSLGQTNVSEIERRTKVVDFVGNSNNDQAVIEILKKNNINLLYVLNDYNKESKIRNNRYLRMIFSNSLGKIYIIKQ